MSERVRHFDRVVRVRRSAFTLVDVLVSLGVIALLIAVMLPSLSAVRTTTRKVLCASNARQIGLGLHMYADDWRGLVPSSEASLPVSTGPSSFSTGDEIGIDALTLRLPDREVATQTGDWDGLGLLFDGDYLPAGPIFYCPSHSDVHTFDRYAGLFAREARVPSGSRALVVGNYEYRGAGPRGERALFLMPAESAIVSDALGTQNWVNHGSGLNVLRAGLSVDWLGAAEGVTGDVLLSLASAGSGGNQDDMWRTLDNSSPSRPGAHSDFDD